MVWVNSSNNKDFKNAAIISSPQTFSGEYECLLDDGCGGWSTSGLTTSQLLFSFLSKSFVLTNYTIMTDFTFTGFEVKTYGSNDGKIFVTIGQSVIISSSYYNIFSTNLKFKPYRVYKFEFKGNFPTSQKIKKITLGGYLRDLQYSCGPDIHKSSRSFALYNVEPIPS